VTLHGFERRPVETGRWGGAEDVDWIYGRNVVQLALAPGARRRARSLAATVAALKALDGVVPAGLPVDVRASHELDEITGSRDHQGVALQVDAFRYAETAEILRADIIVVLDEVSDPRNVGAVARSAAAAGAGGLVLPKHRSASVTPAAVKASAGVIEHLPVAQVTNVVSFLKVAKAEGFWVYGAAGGVATTFWQLDLTGRVVLVFGAEGNGLRPLVARTCDALAAIPMTSRVESLNVSVAAALFLFEASRQRVHGTGGVRPQGGAA
jgi:23S rRNA (guanosine2251-2'-O)-methyltransferase